MLEALVSSIGETQSICPYCQEPLEKKPGSKKKCPHCGNFIYVRTRPHDQQKILVKETDLKQIEYLWNVRSVINDIEGYGETEVYLQSENHLRKRRGKSPSIQDVVWHTGIMMAMEHASNLDFGLCRCDKTRTAWYLQLLQDYNRALSLNLEACYLDLNGPENLGGMPRTLQRKSLAFNLNRAGLAPGIIYRIKTIMTQQTVSMDEVERTFLKHAEAYYEHTKTPVQPLKAWSSLEKELRE